LSIAGIWFLSKIVSANAALRQASEEARKEKEDKRAQAKRSVPSMVRAARLLVNEGQYDDALAQIVIALEFDDQSADAHLLHAQLLLGRQDYATARTELAKCLEHDPRRAEATRLADLARNATKDNTTVLIALSEELTAQRLFAVAERLTKRAAQIHDNRRELEEHYQRTILKAWKWASAGNQLVALGHDDNDKLILTLGNVDSENLDPLRSIPVNRLKIVDSPRVNDISALANMPLEHLYLSPSQVSDLNPLKGLPLTVCEISGAFNDLATFGAMKKLERLNLGGLQRVNSLAGLKGAPIKKLFLGQNDQINSLAGLEGMQLMELSIERFGSLTDLSALADVPIQQLTIQNCTGLTELPVLRKMQLQRLSLSNTGGLRDLTPLADQPLTHFYCDRCGAVLTLEPLRKMPLTHLSLEKCYNVRDFSPLGDMKQLTKLELADAKLEDLKPFAKLPLLKWLILDDCAENIMDLQPLQDLKKLTSLRLTGCEQIKSLAPLKDIQLEHLNLLKCKQMPASLTPLQRMPLTVLALSGAHEENLEALAKMKLKVLHVTESDRLSDISALMGMKSTLTNLVLKNCSSLRDLAPLKGMRLDELDISGCPVADLSPLADMEIRHLDMGKCQYLHDLRPLERLSLQHIKLPPKVTEGWEVLRDMKSLQLIDDEPRDAFLTNRGKAPAKSK
jgi:Leucine-rich repeat (LRR) protein